MRSYIRHPSDMPIELHLEGAGGSGPTRLRDVGFGGLAFESPEPLPVGAQVTVRIPYGCPPFEVAARVTWCRSGQRGHRVGVCFLDRDASYRARMVEQVCHIEHYRREVLEREGRELTDEEAALEWIARYAADFPRE